MKKFVLCLITVLLVVTSVFAAEFKAGVKVDAAGKSDFNIATEEYNVNTLYFSVRPYYTDGHFDVALKLDAGYSFNKGDNGGWYYFLQSYDDLTKIENAEGSGFFDGFSVATISYISNYIDRLLFTTGGLQVGFVRDEQLDVTTLATGKYTKTPNAFTFDAKQAGAIISPIGSAEIPTDSTCQELSAIVSLDFGEHSIYAFADRFDQLKYANQYGFSVTETFGAEIIVPSIFIKDMHYRTSAIADLMISKSTDSNRLYLNVYPEVGFELDTTFGEHKFNLTCALETGVYYWFDSSSKSPEETDNPSFLKDFAAELKANLTLGKFDLATDIYLVRDYSEQMIKGKDSRELFRDVRFLLGLKEETTATALGGSIGTTYHFGKGHELSFSTGIVLDTANGFLPYEFGKYEDGQSYVAYLTNLGTLDFAKVGVKFGQDVWFKADAEVDYLVYFASYLADRGTEEKAKYYGISLTGNSWNNVNLSDIFKLSISAGADLKDIDFEVKVGTGAPANKKGSNNLFDLYGSFKCTVDIHN